MKASIAGFSSFICAAKTGGKSKMPRLSPLSDRRRAERLIEIIRVLSGPKAAFTLLELADSFHVDARTLRRDLALLSEQGFRFDAAAGREGRRRVLRLSQDSPLTLPS